MTIIAAITGGRADWGLLSPVCHALNHDPDFTLKVIATGQHLMTNAGGSLEKITQEGFDLAAQIDMGLSQDDDSCSLTKALGQGMIGLADTLKTVNPDYILLLGDRYEILGAAQTAAMANIPIIHLCGGDITEGAMDDAFRHAITKLSHIHFTTNEPAAQRLMQMGENPQNVYSVGNPGLDHLNQFDRLKKHDFFEEIQFSPHAYNFLVTFHPVTLQENSLEQCKAMLTAFDVFSQKQDIGVIITSSNADPEGQKINGVLKEFVNAREYAQFYESLGTRLYLNALTHCDAMVGNSSSGLYEAPSFNLSAINIGDRQKNRLKADSVIDCIPDTSAILEAIAYAIKSGKQSVINPYGDGKSAEKIMSILKTYNNPKALLQKSFITYEVAS